MEHLEKIAEKIEQLKEDGNIIFWKRTFDEIASFNKESSIDLQIVFFRKNNDIKTFKIKYPNCLNEEQEKYFIKMLTASVYNRVVAEGAETIVVFCDDLDIESRISEILLLELEKDYPNMKYYGNYGEEITIQKGMEFKVEIRKIFEQSWFDFKENEGSLIGIDVGGTNIKCIVIIDSDIKKQLTVKTEKESGKGLKEQILSLIDDLIKDFNFSPNAIGITFPSPIKVNENGDPLIIKMTNFERNWSDIENDYKEINSIINDVKLKYTDVIVKIMNDANAFGFCELSNRKKKNVIGSIVVVLPIGTGPGYVKIKNGVIESIPHQGGHIVIDLLDNALVDIGCSVRGCYGGYIPATATEALSKKHGIEFNKDCLNPYDLGAALEILGYMSKYLADSIYEFYEILEEEKVEFILTGGVVGGKTGKILHSYLRKAIKNKYSDILSCIKISVSQNDHDYLGAIGIAQYANMHYQVNKRKEDITKIKGLKYENNLPEITFGNGIVKNKNYSECLLITNTPIHDFLCKNTYFDYNFRNYITIDDPNLDYIKNQKESVLEDYSTINTIIAIGGGTVIDGAKFIANELNKKLIIIPSSLSTNGMFTEKAILYSGSGTTRTRESLTVISNNFNVIIDFDLIDYFIQNFQTGAFNGKRVNKAGIGDILCIYIALLDWHWASIAGETGKEEINPLIYNRAKKIFQRMVIYQEDLKDFTSIGKIILAELLAEASFLNMRHGSSRPKDGSEHILSDEFEKYMDTTPRLHGELVILSSIIMSYFYNPQNRELAKLTKYLDLYMTPDKIELYKSNTITALTLAKLRKDKFTFFNLHKITNMEAEAAYENIFDKNWVDDTQRIEESNQFVLKTIETIITHIHNKVCPSLNEEFAKKLVSTILACKKSKGRIILNAAGRIGEIAEFFGQQLTAMGFNVLRYVEGTPEFMVNRKDLVLTLSGSGKTGSIINNLNDAVRSSCSLIGITARKDVDTWKLINNNKGFVIEISGRTKDDVTDTEEQSYLPLSSSFEYSVMLYLEGIIESLIIENVENSPGIVRDTISKALLNTITKTLSQLTIFSEPVTAFVTILLDIKKDQRILEPDIYLIGLGRNNYIARLFARRLQNIGYNVFVPGPADIVSKPKNDDLVIFISNSGERDIIINKANVFNLNNKTINKHINCKLIAMTANIESRLAKLSDLVIPIYNEYTKAYTAKVLGPTLKDKEVRNKKRGFETNAMFIFEGISVAIMKLLNLGSADLKHVQRDLE